MKSGRLLLYPGYAPFRGWPSVAGRRRVLAAQDDAPLRIGVLSFRPKPQTLAQWQPVAAHLQQTLKRPVELAAYDHAELGAAASRRVLDMVVTTPNHFILLKHTAGVSAPLATLVSRKGVHELSSYGGVIIARADRKDIAELSDLAGKRIAATSKDAFGSYQMQAAEVLEAGISPPDGDRLLLTGQPNDKVIEAILAGRADAGFIRTGVIEALIEEGRLDPAQIKIINRQDLPTFPYAVSTQLYPEWPVAVTQQVDRTLASRLAAALFLLPGDHLGAASNIAGFTTPANYDGVENLMRHLRLPPFDQVPEIKLADLWHRYAPWIVALSGSMLLLMAASTGLVVMYRRSRQSLREVERLAEKEDLILTSFAEGVYGVDTRGISIFINPRALALLGFAESEVLGRGAHQLFHSHDGSSGEACPVNLTLHDGIKRELEDTFVRRDGVKMPVSLGIAAMTHGNAIVGAVVVFQDITERKQAERARRDAERKLRTLVDNLPHCIARFDEDGRHLFVNPAVSRTFGAPAEHFVGKTFAELGKPGEQGENALLAQRVAAAFRDGLANKTEVHWQTAQGSRVFEVLHVPEKDESGKVVSVLGIAHDISELKKVEAEVRTLNRELERRVAARTAELQEANRELETFTYSVSHDLRQPLRTIDGFLGLLKKRMGGTLDDESRRYMATVSEAALRMARLIDDLLSFSRSGRFELSKAPVDLSALAHEVAREQEQETPGRAVEWRIGELPVVVGDHAMLRVVFSNLISNALKFTQTRQCAEIEIGSQPSGEGEIAVYVRDNGVGFDIQYANKLFGVFQRLHGVDEFKGTGIGLANVRRIIARHGGRTWAEGKVDGGATFYFSLPRPPAPDCQ